jgi:phenylacetate-CoA ligase
MAGLRVLSSIDGAAWPAVPTPAGAALLSIFFQLQQTQWWSPEALAAAQREQLTLLLRHARAHVPFYRRRLPADIEDWDSLPILTRGDVQAAGSDLLAERLPGGHGEPREIFTSGSTGTPIRSLRTQLWELYWSAFTLRDHFWHGRDLTGKLATIRESDRGAALYPDGTRADTWGASGALFATGPMVALNVATPLEQQAEWLRREKPDYLLTHPSLARRLARWFVERSERLPRLKQVITIAENAPADLREVCRAAWNVPVTDIYSAREAGYLGLQCPEHEHYHVQSEEVLLEVIDAEGRPCRTGEPGRVVVTPLHNFAMPLIRYDIGDMAELGDACSCGRGLPVLKRVLGRRQNMLVLPSGEERWTLLSSSDIGKLLALAPIREYQIVQSAASDILLRLVVARPLTAVEEMSLADWVRERYGYPFRVTFAYLDELPRSASGKLEDFVSEVPR